jgi:glyceraldehyde-3-phosphate dehydrogenase/erythrose-4-phosphate dehydrogenase
MPKAIRQPSNVIGHRSSDEGYLVKIMAWYDNEWGFTNQMVRQIKEL